MESDKKYIRKTFFLHQYRQEEKFLSDMRRNGWRVVALHRGTPTKYEFERCEPEEYCYQLDFVSAAKDDESYHQLMKDAGWEYVMKCPAVGGTWYYFGKSGNEEGDRLYTDAESKFSLMDTIWKKSALFLFLAIFMEADGIVSMISIYRHGQHNILSISGVLTVFVVTVFGFVTIFLIYLIIAILKERGRLKKEISKEEQF